MRRALARHTPDIDSGDNPGHDTVNGADTSTSYGVVVFLSSWTMYEPGSTVGGPAASMSPWLSASAETGKVTRTILDCTGLQRHPGKPDQPLGRRHHLADRLATYTGTMSVPARLPVLVTVNSRSPRPCVDTSGVTDRSAAVNVVYDRPNPNG